MSVFVDRDFYNCEIPLWYRDLVTSRDEDIQHFLCNTLNLSNIKVDKVTTKSFYITGWTIELNDPKKETLFRLRYSEYIQ